MISPQPDPNGKARAAADRHSTRRRPGSGRRALLQALALLALCQLPAGAQTNNAPVRPEYSAFKIVLDRNIFNPRRRAQSRQSERRVSSRADTFTLVGIMTYDKGPFAFFDSSVSDFRKVLKPTEAIAGYTVTDIAPAQVCLSAGTNQVQLSVGMQMRREEDGSWRLAAAGSSPARSTPPKSATGTTAAAVATTGTPETTEAPADAEAAAPPDDSTPPADSASTTDDPALKRLMQRREQELNR